MATLPSSLALTTISDGALATAADLRNNFTAVQTENNSLLTILGGGAAGDVFTGVGTTVQFAKPPGYEYAYTEFTANVVPTGTTAPNAIDVVSAGAVTFDGSTTVIVEFYSDFLSPAPAANATVSINLWDSTTDIGQIAMGQSYAATNGGGPCYVRRRLTPSAAAHTYKARIWASTIAGAFVGAGAGGAGTAMPGFIRITKA